MDLAGARDWIFDLDGTLAPPALFAQIEARMQAHVERRLALSSSAARAVRAAWKRRHGTTLAGLMAEHGADPLPFLAEVHDIDLGALVPDPPLAAALAALPGRRILHTSADAAHAERVIARLGLPPFEAIWGIAETGFVPKPDPRAYDAVLAAHDLDPARCAFVEDDPRNLEYPRRLGMQTVLVIAPEAPVPDGAAGHVVTRDLAGLLVALEAPAPGVAVSGGN